MGKEYNRRDCYQRTKRRQKDPYDTDFKGNDREGNRLVGPEQRAKVRKNKVTEIYGKYPSTTGLHTGVGTQGLGTDFVDDLLRGTEEGVPVSRLKSYGNKGKDIKDGEGGKIFKVVYHGGRWINYFTYESETRNRVVVGGVVAQENRGGDFVYGISRRREVEVMSEKT